MLAILQCANGKIKNNGGKTVVNNEKRNKKKKKKKSAVVLEKIIINNNKKRGKRGHLLRLQGWRIENKKKIKCKLYLRKKKKKITQRKTVSRWSKSASKNKRIAT